MSHADGGARAPAKPSAILSGADARFQRPANGHRASAPGSVGDRTRHTDGSGGPEGVTQADAGATCHADAAPQERDDSEAPLPFEAYVERDDDDDSDALSLGDEEHALYADIGGGGRDGTGQLPEDDDIEDQRDRMRTERLEVGGGRTWRARSPPSSRTRRGPG